MEKKTERNAEQTRREFVKSGAAAAAAVGTAVALRLGHLRPTFAAGSDELRVGLIGCGKRGTGAVGQALTAGKGVRLVAMADAFQDRLTSSLETLRKNEEAPSKTVTFYRPPGALDIDVPPERQFVGLDAYKKLLAIPEINYVIIASPPGFKPEQIRAAITAGKNVFAEKPMAVDGPGIRICFEMAELARKKNLGVGIGLQRHHQRAYLETMKRLHGGAIGEIVAGRCAWMQGGSWVKPRNEHKEWSDLEWQMRNWPYFTWLSGDHIVEQHVHNIDVMSWGIGKPPVAAVGMGGRQQRIDPAYGHVYDHFAVDFEYPNDVHVLSMARQIPECAGAVDEHFVGTHGRAIGSGRITSGKKYWAYEPKDDTSPYLQEHIDLIDSIRKGKPLNELKSAAEGNLAGIMGRMSAYSGKRVTWEQALASKVDLTPKPLSFSAKMPVPRVAIPGSGEEV